MNTKPKRYRFPLSQEGFFLKTGKKGDVLYTAKAGKIMTSLANSHHRKVKTRMVLLVEGHGTRYGITKNSSFTRMLKVTLLD